jgi:hypothetical protein
MLKKKDFQEIARLAWAQEVWSSNLHAPTNPFSDLEHFTRFEYFGE